MFVVKATSENEPQISSPKFVNIRSSFVKNEKYLKAEHHLCNEEKPALELKCINSENKETKVNFDSDGVSKVDEHNNK